MRSVPHRCEFCLVNELEPSYYGTLVFGTAKPPKCRNCKRPLTPVPDYERNYREWLALRLDGWYPSFESPEEETAE